MWDYIFHEFIFRPQLNILQYLFNFTRDIGFALIIIALVFNLLAFRWFTKSFLNTQKRLALGQEFKNIQHYFKEKNKIMQDKVNDLSMDLTKNQDEINSINIKLRSGIFDQQKLTGELNKKFNIVGNYTLKTLFLQLWVSLGLFNLFHVITDTKNLKGVPGLYEFLWNGQYLANFGSSVKAFGNIEISKTLTETGLVWLPVVNAFFTYLAMRYSFKNTMKPDVRALTEFETIQKDKIQLQNEKEGVPDLDPEKIAKQSQTFNLYLIPVITSVANFAFPTGLNIYYCFLSILFFFRTWLADLYYKNHQKQYMVDLMQASPIFPYQEHMEDLTRGNFDLRGTPTEVLSTSK